MPWKVPYPPGFVIVNEPPTTSSGVSFLSRARSRDVRDRLRHAEQVQRLRVLHDRHDQALAVGKLDGEAEVDEALRDDLVAANLAVHVRVVAQCLGRRPRDEREIGRVDAVGRRVLLLQLPADRDHLRHVDLDRARDVRRCVERLAHVLGDPATHRRHRLERLAGAGSLRLLGSDRRLRGDGARAARAVVPTGGAAPPVRWRCCDSGTGAGRRRGGRLARAGGAGGPAAMKAWMSFLVTRPPPPVPGTCVGSMPCSAAIRATTGETNERPFPDGAA